MAEEREVRATQEEVEGFVGKLRDFHGSLDESEQAMLGTILEGAQSSDTGGYGFRAHFDWDGLVDFLTQGDDTQGFGFTAGRRGPR